MLEIEERMALPDLTESFVQVEANGSINLAGKHTARIPQVKRVVSPKGTPLPRSRYRDSNWIDEGESRLCTGVGGKKQGRVSSGGWFGARLNKESAPRG